MKIFKKKFFLSYSIDIDLKPMKEIDSV